MSACRMDLPIAGAKPCLRTWLKRLVEPEARAKLTGWLIGQGYRVPLGHLLRMAGWDPCFHIRITGLQSRIAAAVIAVQMGIDEKIKASSTQCGLHQ